MKSSLIKVFASFNNSLKMVELGTKSGGFRSIT